MHSSVSYVVNLCNLLARSYTCTVNFRSHFSRSFDRYNNRPTVHACTIAKASMVCFYWGLIHGPVWRPWVLGWSVNDSNLPGQADSWQSIATGLAGGTGHRCSYILRRVQLKITLFGHKKVFASEVPATSWLPTTTLHPYRNGCGIDYLVKYINYLKWRAFQLTRPFFANPVTTYITMICRTLQGAHIPGI